MADKDTPTAALPTGWPRAEQADFGSTALTQDMVMESAPSYAVASLMIGSAQSQTRAMAAEVAALQHFFIVGLTTASQNATRLLEEPSLQQKQLNALLEASKM
ncbi:MAG: hypothetical protein QNJ16_14455 [Rhodobacter sp.]|nr:hypothetical protein [Rhodobacter sp.]